MEQYPSYSYSSSDSSSSPNPQTNSSPSNCEHDVFLSFRGADTRYSFTDHLHHALCQKRIKTFIDSENLLKGRPISKLYEAIENSKFAVIVFSTNYATSIWCLNELAHIVKCKNLRGMEVLPVFYHVEPSEIKRQSGNYGVAFDKHEADLKDDLTKVDNWRQVLEEIGLLSGWHLTPFRSEVQVINEIVDRITNVLYSMLSDPNRKLVGIDARLKRIESCLELESNNILTLGIWGMGGIGKTTLAEEVFKKISNQFDPSHCFKSEVKSQSPLQLLRCLSEFFLGKNCAIIDTVENGIKLLKKALSMEKVLIVLDDVLSFSQIECLAREGALGENIWGAGSRLIITTRDRSSLMRNPNNSEDYLYTVEKLRVYEVEKLRDNEALQLLCQTAFKNGIPPSEFKDLSDSFLQYAGGIPLAHKVLGSYLSRYQVPSWPEIFHRLDDDWEEDIFGVLQISYNGLRETDMKIFLDIACFFYGEDCVRVQNIFSGFDYASPQEGIRTLVNKSLIKIESGKLQMHNLIRCLCWHIVRQESSLPGKRSRLWIDDNTHKYGGRSSWRFEGARDVLMDNMGTNAVEGLLVNLHEEEEMSLEDDPFKKMGGLRFLKLYNVKFLGVHFHVCRNLRVIEWHECPLRSLPDNLKWANLVEIKMPNSRIIKLWNGQPLLEKLKLVDLSHCQFLASTPNFSGVQNLERLILQGCNQLSELHSTIWDIQELKYLNLKGCTSLQSLPRSISMRSLEIFILSGCSKLQKFPDIGENMNKLSKLYLDGTAVQELPVSMKHLRGIILLKSDCRNILSVPSILCSSLTSLNLNLS